MFGIKRCLAIAAGAAGALLTLSSTAIAQADFFKGKTVTYIVATAPGGGFDGYGRLMARYMEKQLPGASIIVRNLPGAGHLIGTNTIYAAKPDGLTIGTFNIGVMYSQLTGSKSAQFDLGRMSWIGKAASDTWVIVVSADSPYREFADLQKSKEPVPFAMGGIGSATYTQLNLLASAFGLNLKMLLGYSGNDDEMAMRRGEVVGRLGSYASLSPFVKNGYGRFVLQIGGEAQTDLATVTMGESIARTPEEKAVIALIVAQAKISRVTTGPPGIAAERLQILRDAYRRSLRDPQLLDEARKLDWPIEPMFGEDVTKIVQAALQQPPKILAMIEELQRPVP